MWCLYYFEWIRNIWMYCKSPELNSRNMFLNQENIRKFFSKQANSSSQERLSLPSTGTFILEWRKWSNTEKVFLEIRNVFKQRKYPLYVRKFLCFSYWGEKKTFLSWKTNFLVLRRIFQYFLDLRTCFSNQEGDISEQAPDFCSVVFKMHLHWNCLQDSSLPWRYCKKRPINNGNRLEKPDGRYYFPDTES